MSARVNGERTASAADGMAATGVVGTGSNGALLDDLLAETGAESWYETDRFERSDIALGMHHHGSRDSGGHATWEDGSRAGIVYGAIVDPPELSELFEGLLSSPSAVLPSLDGSFLLAAVDGETDRVVVATDKLGTRPCYYVSDGPFAFGSHVGPLLAELDEPTIDERAVSDMLLIGHVWGEKTLVEGVDYLPSGSVLEYEDDRLTVSRYWDHEFGQRDGPEYVSDLVGAYRSAVADMASTLDSDVGLWLSGGLDSRTMATELSRHVPLSTYTYDANPVGGGNLDVAETVADTLGVSNHQVELTPDRFDDVLDRCVSLTDGMVTMVTFVNLSAVFNMPGERRPGVVLEGCGQGGMMGDGIKRTTIERSRSPERALYEAKHLTDIDTVRGLLASDVEPMSTYRTAVAQSDQPDLYTTVMDCYYRNYFARGDFGSNPIARSQAGTRVPFAHTEFLDAITKLPLSDRTRTFPYTKVPMATSPMKLKLVREIDQEMAEIPYQRTKLPPTRPLWQHALGFVGGTLADRLRRSITYGGRSMTSEWYHAGGPFADRIETVLSAAADRDCFDADELERLRTEHENREANHMAALSGVVTTELWFRNHLD